MRVSGDEVLGVDFGEDEPAVVPGAVGGGVGVDEGFGAGEQVGATRGCE